VSDTADQAPLTTERDAASLLKRPPAPTTKQARAAARAKAKAARLARRKALAEQRRRRGPVIPSFGLRGPGGVPPGWWRLPRSIGPPRTGVRAVAWSVGAGTPMIGTPIGHHLETGATVCFDPLSWFLRAKLIFNPSLFMLGLPALGKSTFIRKLVTGATATGVSASAPPTPSRPQSGHTHGDTHADPDRGASRRAWRHHTAGQWIDPLSTVSPSVPWKA